MSYGTAIGWLFKLSFNLLRSAVLLHKRFKSTQAGVYDVDVTEAIISEATGKILSLNP